MVAIGEARKLEIAEEFADLVEDGNDDADAAELLATRFDLSVEEVLAIVREVGQRDGRPGSY